jgi:hypothetical protein
MAGADAGDDVILDGNEVFGDQSRFFNNPNLDEESEFVVTSQDQTELARVRETINGIADLTEEHKNLSIALSTAFALSSRKHAKRIEVKRKVRAEATEGISDFALDLTKETAEGILGVGFRDHVFKNDLTKVLTKQALLQKALRSLAGVDHAATRELLETALGGLNISEAIAQNNEGVSKRAIAQIHTEKANIINQNVELVKPPVLGTNTIVPAGVLKNLSTSVYNQCLDFQSSDKLTRQPTEYFRLVRNTIMCNYNSSAAYDILAHVLKGDSLSYLNSCRQDGRTFGAAFNALQICSINITDPLQTERQLEKILKEGPNATNGPLGSCLMSIYTLNRKLNNNLPLSERSQATFNQSKTHVYELVKHYYPYHYATIRNEFEALFANASSPTGEGCMLNWETLLNVTNNTLANIPPIKGDSAEKTRPKLAALVLDTKEGENQEYGENPDMQNFGPQAPNRGNPNQSYPQGGFQRVNQGVYRGGNYPNRGNYGNSPNRGNYGNYQNQGYQNQGYPGRTNQNGGNQGYTTGSMQTYPQGFIGKCFLCGSVEHRFSYCNRYSDKMINKEQCMSCRCYHVGKCINATSIQVNEYQQKETSEEHQQN